LTDVLGLVADAQGLTQHHKPTRKGGRFQRAGRSLAERQEMSITLQPQPHQQRVVDEKTELDTKATALSKFIGESTIFPALDAAEQERLKEQCELMWQYSEILGARIAAFSQPAAKETNPKEGCARFESEAKIIGGKLVISLRIGTLAHAARNSDHFFNCAESGTPIKITDETVFAASVSRALNREEEDGSTPITRMLDEATEWVSEQGEEGIEEA
jgi:hypothetical protein